jgi:hypothetical protein
VAIVSLTSGLICEPRDARFQIRPHNGDDDLMAYCDVDAHELLGDKVFSNGFDI